MNKPLILRSLALAALLATALSAHSVELVKDGDFELASYQGRNNSFLKGESFDGGLWTVGDATNGDSGVPATLETQANLVIGGAVSAEAVDASIYQTLPTTVGQPCTISFDAYSRANAPDTAPYTVKFGSETFNIDVPGLAPGFLPPTPIPHFTFTVVPTTTSTLLTLGSDRLIGVIVDNVSVTQAVPEPATLAALGLGAFELLRRRRSGR